MKKFKRAANPNAQSYLNNRDLMVEVHKSKMSFCNIIGDKEKVFDFDCVIDSIDELFTMESTMTVGGLRCSVNNIEETRLIRAHQLAEEKFAEEFENNPDTTLTIDDFMVDLSTITVTEINCAMTRARESRATRLTAYAYAKELKANPQTTLKLKDFKIDPASIPRGDLVFRYMTYEHIPSKNTAKNPKTTRELHVDLNFRPFKHVTVNDDDSINEVVWSHYTADGQFSKTHGKITDGLAKIFLLLVNRVAMSSNWRNYSYVDEMRGQAILQLTQYPLKFDERYGNAFAYYTSYVNNAFSRVWSNEKKVQKLRDDLLEHAGMSPSMTRQLEAEAEMRAFKERNDY